MGARTGAEALADETLLEAWRGGDEALGNELFKRHVVAVSRFFRTKVPDSTEDLTQATFLALVEGKDRFRGESAFRAFVFGVARKQLLMHLRARGRAAARFDPLTWSAIDGGASPARLAFRHQQQQLIVTAMQELPLDTQIALELHYMEGMAIKDIAAVVGQPVGTVKSRLSRGRSQLADKLTELASPGELLTSTLGRLDHWIRSIPETAGDRRTE